MQDEQQYERIPVIIKKIIPETPDAKTFVLATVSGDVIDYQPGQFLTFVFDSLHKGSVRRNYSISSSPALQEPLQVTVKRIPNGEFSRLLIDHAKEGEHLFVTGASGFFTLPTDLNLCHQIIFFAAGSGITPIFSMIKTALTNNATIRVVLIYSNTSPDNAIFHHALKELQHIYYDRFDIEFLFSSSKSILHKRLSGHLLDIFLGKYLIGEKDRQLFYTCGPFEYMRMISIVLRNHGIPANHIRKEIFTIEAPARKQEPIDKDDHQVTLSLRGKEYHFNVQYPQTILQKAKSLQIPLPYSCESGQCGTCAATCVKGKVWMWHNEVLMDEEISAGRVLTCTGYAVDGDIILEF